ncbi:MAG: ribosome silencing factor [Gammaproteobacteria bacterium]
MQDKKLEKLVNTALEDYKALEITTLDIREMTSLADAMIICSATSKRHAQSIAENLILKAKSRGYQPLGVEGETTGEWILIDLGDVIVHIMLKNTREFYSLEKLWTSAESIRKKYSY